MWGLLEHQKFCLQTQKVLLYYWWKAKIWWSGALAFPDLKLNVLRNQKISFISGMSFHPDWLDPLTGTRTSLHECFLSLLSSFVVYFDQSLEWCALHRLVQICFIFFWRKNLINKKWVLWILIFESSQISEIGCSVINLHRKSNSQP